MGLLYQIFIDPFVQMGAAPDLLCRRYGRVSSAGILYSLIALGFVLIFKASGVFNFAQGIMVVFAALTLVGLYDARCARLLALALTIAVMFGLAFAVERLISQTLGQSARYHLVHGDLRPDLFPDRIRRIDLRWRDEGHDR